MIFTVMATNTTRGVNDTTVEGQKIDGFTVTVKATSTSRPVKNNSIEARTIDGTAVEARR